MNKKNGFESSYVFHSQTYEKNNNIDIQDVGCNAGDLTNEIFTNIFQLDENAFGYGVDVDKHLIERAKSRFGRMEFDTLDASSSSFVKHIQSKIPSFDLVTCFGTTMWIHLHHGDVGLKAFLLRLVSLSSSYIILEPQPLKCYKSAKKRMKRSKIQIPEATKQLQWVKSNEMLYSKIDQILSESGFALLKTLGHTKWNRRILLYRKRPL